MQVQMKIEESFIEENYERIFFISDIHNDYENYCKMKNKLGWNKGDLVIILGDIVDRGGEKADPISLCKEVRY